MSDWFEREADAKAVDALERAGHPHLLARLLASRGVTAEGTAAYFAPSLSGLAAPRELPNVERAAAKILATVRKGDKIVVFGDYDCDGVCATAILVRALRALGAKVAGFLPERLTEGYGMGEESVARLLKEHPDVRLVITVDNGINSISPVQSLRVRGVSAIVTDHHLPGSALPNCIVVNPKVDAPEALKGLCGAGVAFLLANALVSAAKAEGLYSGPSLAGPLLILAGLATVTDIMPLRGQNRILVAEALRHFAQWAPVGLWELYLAAARRASECFTTRDFGFLIGPRINAAGRMASGVKALDLVLCDDREKAREAAREVEQYNLERKRVESEMSERALARLVPGAAAQVVDLSDGHPGVVGIVAARLLEHLNPHVPVCVVVNGRGSARAPEGYNLRAAFTTCDADLENYGGHAAAGGVTVRPGHLESFRAHFAAVCAAQAASAPVGGCGATPFDAWVRPSDLTLEFAEQVRRMEPFGEANPEPVFAMRAVTFNEVRQLGADGRHLSATVVYTGGGGGKIKAVWWGHGADGPRLRAPIPYRHDILFTIEISDYGERHVEIRLVAERATA